MTREDFILAWLKRRETRCFYCSTEFGPPYTLLVSSIEHVYPKHKFPKLNMNEVKACRGCNFAKNGFMPEDFRAYLTGGEDFFCEKILGERLPPLVQSLHDALHHMVNTHFYEEIKEINNMKSPRSMRTTERLRDIMRDLRKKDLTRRAERSRLIRVKEA